MLERDREMAIIKIPLLAAAGGKNMDDERRVEVPVETQVRRRRIHVTKLHLLCRMGGDG